MPGSAKMVSLITEQEFDLEHLVEIVWDQMGNAGLEKLILQALKNVDSEEDFQDIMKKIGEVE